MSRVQIAKKPVAAKLALTVAQVRALLEECVTMHEVEGSFADTIPDDELTGPPMSAAEKAEWTARNKQWQEETQAASAKSAFKRVVKQLNCRPCAMQLQQARLEEYWADRDAWVYTQPDFKRMDIDDWHMGTEDMWTELYDAHMARVEARMWGGSKEMCRFFQLPAGCRAGADCMYSHEVSETASVVSDIHRDANGEPEICRYFNLPGGCTREADGKGACPYKHIEGVAPEPEICRFFNSPKGCRSGDKCIFKHEKVVEKDWRAPAETWSRGSTPPVSPWRSSGGSGTGIAMNKVGVVPSEEVWETAGAKKQSKPPVHGKRGGGRW